MDFCESPIVIARIVCPKPRRAGSSNFNNPMMPLRFHNGNDAEKFDSKPGAELLDLILGKDREIERCATVPSSPPFFFGTPPCRAPNPLSQDARFGVEKPTSICSSPSPSPSDSTSPLSVHARFNSIP